MFGELSKRSAPKNAFDKGAVRRQGAFERIVDLHPIPSFAPFLIASFGANALELWADKNLLRNRQTRRFTKRARCFKT